MKLPHISKHRQALLMGGAILSATLASFFAFMYLKAKGEKIPVKIEVSTQPVVVAGRDLPALSVLSKDSLEVVQWPVESLPKGAINNIEWATGRMTKTDLMEGEPILVSKIVPPDGGSGLEVLIPEGKRAVTISVDEVTGLSGFLSPKSRVDVLVSFQREGDSQSPMLTRTVLQNVLVLAVSGKTDNLLPQEEGAATQVSGVAKKLVGQQERRQVTTVTLAVSPEEAERIILSTASGKLHLILRKFGDIETVSTPGVSSSDLLPEELSLSPPEAGARGPEEEKPLPSHSVEIIKGEERTTQDFY